MDRVERLELVKRSLALRHKLKVHESMKTPDTHEELAIFLMTKWDLEDELKAVELLIVEDRDQTVQGKKEVLETEWLGKPKRPALKKAFSKKKR